MTVPTPVAVPGRRRRSLVGPLVAVAVLAVAGAFVVVLASSDPATMRQARSPLLGGPAPELAGTTLDEGSFSLADRKGRWVLVNFFATWCTPCQREHPELVAFSRAHAAAGDAEVVSVVFNDEVAKARAWFAANGGEWAVVADESLAIALDWGVVRVPESYLVDPNGFVVSKILGGVTAEGLDELLARAVAGESS